MGDIDIRLFLDYNTYNTMFDWIITYNSHNSNNNSHNNNDNNNNNINNNNNNDNKNKHV